MQWQQRFEVGLATCVLLGCAGRGSESTPAKAASAGEASLVQQAPEAAPVAGQVERGALEPGANEPSPPSEPEAQLSPRERDRRGDEHLLAGRFAEAMADFDAYLEAEPEADPYHWRRGIACYYAERYEEGAAQFERHRLVNPADVENAAWHYLCRARLSGVESAREGLLPVGFDARAPLMRVYELYAGRSTPEEVLAEAEAQPEQRRASARFYAHLYLGLFHEVGGEAERARHHLELAATTYASPGYMGDVARMHAALLAR